jgi:peptidoglycan/LPS O-acetylase OafA/YrhL
MGIDLVQQEYRRDIDGLRAISVLSVLLFHIGIGRVSGGFVGVDVFFVISGFLVSGRVYHGMASGNFGFIDFYERRARRILPAYFFVSTLTAVAAILFFLPNRMVEFSNSLIASSLFSANIFFWTQANYFGPAAETQPLLHYWSLGVEEHFYLLFPVLVLTLWRFGLRALGILLALVVGLSLVASQWMLNIDPMASFYLIPFRAWELFIGSILALPIIRPPRSRMIGATATATGLALIFSAVFLYDNQTRFPGVAAVPPTLGAALFIWGGQGDNIVNRFAGLVPLNYIGRISYSLYLVHWPVIIFSKQRYPDADASSWMMIAGILAGSLLLASFSYHFVETTTRRRNGFWRPRPIFALSAIGVVASLAFAGLSVLSSGFPGRLPVDVQALLAYKYDRSEHYREGKCFLRPDQSFGDIDRAACLPAGGPAALLWGDSFAAHYVFGIRPMLESHGYVLSQLNASGCAPIVGRDVPSRPNCKSFNDFTLDWIIKNRPKIVVMSAAWNFDADSLKLFTNSIQKFPTETSIIILGPSPQYRKPVPDILADRRLRGDYSTLSQGDLTRSVFVVDNDMKKLSELNRVIYISVLEAICRDKQCPMYIKGTPVHWDTGHLTDVGSVLLVRAFMSRFGPSDAKH